MINGMLQASRGCLKETMRMDCIANNLANATVIGFKKDSVSFQDILGSAGNTPPLVNVETDMSQGDIVATGNTLDLALNGPGFFKIETLDGIRFTRKGNFSLNSEGEIVTQGGHRLLDDNNAPLTVNGSDISISTSGAVTVGDGEEGQIEVVDFIDYRALEKDGESMYKNVLEETGIIAPDTTIQQGYVESSNVQIAQEMVTMIHSSRAFESYQKSLQVLDQVNGKAVNEVGRLR